MVLTRLKTTLLQGCCQLVMGSQPAHNLVIWLLQGCDNLYQVVTRLLQPCEFCMGSLGLRPAADNRLERQRQHRASGGLRQTQHYVASGSSLPLRAWVKATMDTLSAQDCVTGYRVCIDPYVCKLFHLLTCT